MHIKVGVCCGWGGGSRLVQLVGPSRALELLSSGRLVSAHEALQLGLSNATITHIAQQSNDCNPTTKLFKTSTLADNSVNVKQIDAQDQRLIAKNCLNNSEKDKIKLCNFKRSSCDLNGNNHNVFTRDGNESSKGNKTSLEMTPERLEALEFLCMHTIGNLETIKALKSMINAARFELLHDSLAKEAHLFASTWGKEAHLQALADNIKHN